MGFFFVPGGTAPPQTPGRLYVFPAKGREIEILDSGRVFAGVIQEINAGNGTIDIAYSGGLLQNVPVRKPETKHLALTWRWPNAPEPKDPPPVEPKRAC